MPCLGLKANKRQPAQALLSNVSRSIAFDERNKHLPKRILSPEILRKMPFVYENIDIRDAISYVPSPQHHLHLSPGDLKQRSGD